MQAEAHHTEEHGGCGTKTGWEQVFISTLRDTGRYEHFLARPPPLIWRVTNKRQQRRTGGITGSIVALGTSPSELTWQPVEKPRRSRLTSLSCFCFCSIFRGGRTESESKTKSKKESVFQQAPSLSNSDWIQSDSI